MKTKYLPIIGITISFIIGIVISFHNSIVPEVSLPLLFLFLVIYLIALHYSKKRGFFNRFLWYWVYVCALMLGAGIMSLNNQSLDKLHYSKEIIAENAKFEAQIVKNLKSGAFSHNYLIRLRTLNGLKVKGRLLLNVLRDSAENYRIQNGEIIMFFAKPELISPPSNPWQFDYQNYMRKQQVYHRVKINPQHLLRKNQPNINLWLSNFKSGIVHKLRISGIFGLDELALLQALLLGERSELSPSLYEAYQNAGAVHILAISGLHVGVFLLLLNFAFSPLNRLKHGIIIKWLLTLTLLWAFALLAGFTASVVRAVCMFSFLSYALQIDRRANTLNILFVSAFVLLLFRPFWVFNVGFQLSYSAVLAIVIFNPLFASLWKPPGYIFNKLWQLSTVSLSAQIGVLPLSLYYFHQFPGLFMLSSLVLVPFLGLILGGGIVVIVLSQIDFLPTAVGLAFNKILQFMNAFVRWVGEKENYLFEDIYFDGFLMCSVFILIIGLYLFSIKRYFPALIIVVLGIIAIQLRLMNVLYKQEQEYELMVLQKTGNTIIGQRDGSELIFFTDEPVQTQRIAKNYRSHTIGLQTKNQDLENIYGAADKILYLVGEHVILPPKNVETQYLLLQNSPKIHLTRLIDSLRPKMVIADGSNYYGYVSRWRKTCESQGMPFHHTAKEGTFFIKYE